MTARATISRRDFDFSREYGARQGWSARPFRGYNGSRLVTRNKQLRRRIAGYEQQILDHEQKIRTELAKPSPSDESIATWEREIQTFKDQIERLMRRLRREW